MVRPTTGPNKPAPGGPGVYPPPVAGAAPARRSRTAAELDSVVDGIVDELDRRARERIVAESDDKIASLSETIVAERRGKRRMRNLATGLGTLVGGLFGAFVVAALTGALQTMIAALQGAKPEAVVERVEAATQHTADVAEATIAAARLKSANDARYAEAIAELQLQRDMWVQRVVEASAHRRPAPAKPAELLQAEEMVALMRATRKAAE